MIFIASVETVQLRKLRRVVCYLTTDVSILEANVLIGISLDYCNSLIRIISKRVQLTF